MSCLILAPACNSLMVCARACQGGLIVCGVTAPAAGRLRPLLLPLLLLSLLLYARRFLGALLLGSFQGTSTGCCCLAAAHSI